MMGYGTGLGFGFGGWLVLLGCVLLAVGAVALIAWVIGKVNHSAQSSGPGYTQTPSTPAAPEALEVLRLRFARGEISADEFAAASKVLGGGR